MNRSLDALKEVYIPGEGGSFGPLVVGRSPTLVGLSAAEESLVLGWNSLRGVLGAAMVSIVRIVGGVWG